MRRSSTPRSAAAALVALVVLTLALGACTSLPEAGPVIDADVTSGVDDTRASDINVLPPAPKAAPVDIVKGFLDAMTASPARTDIVKEFLTEDAASAWDPEASTITYGDKYSPREEGGVVVVPLIDAQRLDRAGAWKGRLPESEQRLRLDLTVEDGEWRITDPPDALVVPLPWFNQRYRQTSLYFFDPSGSILVPQPVFVPRGEQLATTLISGLLAGPGPELRDVVRSYLPTGLSLDLSVPISPSGLADIHLLGEAGAQSPANLDRMLAQLAWTLRQEPSITSLRVTIGDQVVQVPGGGTTYEVEKTTAYDPNGEDSSVDLFALRDKVLTMRDGNELVPVPGPFGVSNFAVRSVAVDLDASDAAVVSDDGTTALVGPMDVGADSSPDAAVPVLTGAFDLLAPAWDFAGRVWLVDRTPDGAVVRYVKGGQPHRLLVPGVSGRVVKSFLVSRDGTRFVAVVRGADSDDLRIGRIGYNTRGQPDVVRSTSTLLTGPAEELRITGLTWTSPTAVSLLVSVIPGEFYEVRTLGVDGAPPTATDLSTTVSGAIIAITGVPEASITTYGVTKTGLLDLVTEASYGFVGDPPTSIGYVG